MSFWYYLQSMKILRLLFLILIVFHAGLQAKEQKKVALLFLTQSDLNQSELWKLLLMKDAKNFTVYLHPREHVKCPFFHTFVIPGLKHTTWSDHMNAWRRLLRRALADPNNYKFILLSESHIPLRPLKEIYRDVTKDNRTYMIYWHPWWPEDNAREVIELPKEHRYVHSEWVILNRHHASLMCQDDLVLKQVQKHPHTCEAYMASLFSFYGCLENGEVERRETTFVDFQLGKDSHPYQFEDASEFNLNLLRKAKAEGMLFARKIAPGVPLKPLLKIILERQGKN